ncbi:hypothetical protein F5X99DRAFT_409348 [Biscogniauxia marginata]|nr:hypothetical protein F5X99DRAFT_409348 [Biscogniauxia marginata]
MDFIDVAIIGGGPTGLTATATLARQLYTAMFADVEVTKVEKEKNSHFKIQDSHLTEWNFRKVILVVGSSDAYPDIEGYEQLRTKGM